MNQINLNKLTLTELIQLQQEIPKAISKAKKAEKNNVIKQIETIAAEAGFDLEEILALKKEAKPKRKVKPKYRNPDDPKQTWTGRGRRPKWVEQHLLMHGTLDDILI